MNRIVSSLKKRIDMQPAQPVQRTPNPQETQMMPAERLTQPRQVRPRRTAPGGSTDAQRVRPRPVRVQDQPQNAQPIEHVRRIPGHLLDEENEDDMINEMLSPSRRRREGVQQIASGQNRSVRTPRALQQPQNRQRPQDQIPPRRQPQGTHTPANGSRRQQQSDNKKTIYRPDPNADYGKFYLIFACTSPLWGFLALCLLALFALVLAAMFVGIFALIGVLFVGVAVGSIVALVGIIFGITQLFGYAPIGLYEIGLGIRVGGFVMLGGIIVYNVAVRLLPYLIRRELDLFTFTIHKCIELYYRVKGACADL